MKTNSIEDLLWERRADIKWYEWLYQISDMGRVKSLPREIDMPRWWTKRTKCKILKLYVEDRWVGWYISLSNNWIVKRQYIQLLVAHHFLEEPLDRDNYEIFYKDWNWSNTRYDNLWFITHKNRHQNTRVRKKSVVQKDMDWNIITYFDSARSAWKIFYKWSGVSSSVSACCLWKRPTAYWYKREYVNTQPNE